MGKIWLQLVIKILLRKILRKSEGFLVGDR